MSDLYASPTADLDTTKEYDAGDSLARGIAGDYRFSVADALKEASYFLIGPWCSSVSSCSSSPGST